MKFMTYFIVLATFLATLTSCSNAGTANRESLDAKAFSAAITSGNPEEIVILDVRTKDEFDRAHIKDAININIYEPNFASVVDNLEKDKKIYVYCKSGGRSASAANILGNKGFKEIYELEGGLLKWQLANLPLVHGNVSTPKNMSYTLEEYNNIVESNDLVLFDFMADWCGPCKMMAPGLHNIEMDYPENLKVVKINVDFNQELSQKFQISSIPAIKIYHKGKLVEDIVGARSEPDLRSTLGPYLGS